MKWLIKELENFEKIIKYDWATVFCILKIFSCYVRESYFINNFSSLTTNYIEYDIMILSVTLERWYKLFVYIFNQFH